MYFATNSGWYFREIEAIESDCGHASRRVSIISLKHSRRHRRVTVSAVPSFSPLCSRENDNHHVPEKV